MTADTVLVIGATGAAGRHVVADARHRGLGVVAFTRRSGSIEAAPGVTPMVGDPFVVESIGEALRGVNAVIDCIGVGGRGDGRQTRVVSTSMDALTSAVAATGRPIRVVLMSNIGAGDGSSAAARFRRRFLWPLVTHTVLRWLPPIIDDNRRAERMLRASTALWTVIRFPNLVEGSSRNRVRLGSDSDGLGGRMTFVDAARLLVDAAIDRSPIGRVISASN